MSRRVPPAFTSRRLGAFLASRCAASSALVNPPLAGRFPARPPHASAPRATFFRLNPALARRLLVAPLLTGPFLISLSLAMAAPASTLMLDMPAPATVIGGRQVAPSSLRLPIGPFAAGEVPLREAEGAISQRAYRMDDQHLTTLAIMAPLLAQLQASGYKTLFQCETSACGGFDFRYGMDVLPEPQMHVDLGDFRYVVAERPGAEASDGPDLVALLVSRSTDAGFVQVTTISPQAIEVAARPADTALPQATASAATTEAAPPAPVAQTTPTPPPQTDMGAALLANGAVALDDLIFPSGSSALEDGDYASLTALSAFLHANPARHVVLVGHTDAVGSLAANTTLSRQRAQSVRATLIAKFTADPTQIDAQGAGYLAPRASNETPEGRTKNRRVEVMLTPTP